MTRNINSDAENCQAEVGVPRGAFTPDGLGASYSGVTCPGGGQFTPGGYFLRNTPVSMADVRHKTVRAVHSVGQARSGALSGPALGTRQTSYVVRRSRPFPPSGKVGYAPDYMTFRIRIVTMVRITIDIGKIGFSYIYGVMHLIQNPNLVITYNGREDPPFVDLHFPGGSDRERAIYRRQVG